jgi:hypothetical protein
MKTHGMRWLGSKRIASVAIGIGLLTAALALPAAASAQSAGSETSMPRDLCLFLEENIADYDCGVSLAQWAGDADQIQLAPAPDGVDYLFWEENVLNFAVSGPTFEGNEDPQSLFPEADDVAQQGAGVVNY